MKRFRTAISASSHEEADEVETIKLESEVQVYRFWKFIDEPAWHADSLEDAEQMLTDAVHAGCYGLIMPSHSLSFFEIVNNKPKNRISIIVEHEKMRRLAREMLSAGEEDAMQEAVKNKEYDAERKQWIRYAPGGKAIGFYDDIKPLGNSEEYNEALSFLY